MNIIHRPYFFDPLFFTAASAALGGFPRLKEGCSKTAPETTEAVHWALVTRNQEYLLVNFENYDILLI